MKALLVVVLCILLINTASGLKKASSKPRPPPKSSCPSGVIGPACSKNNNPCKPGYTCIRKRCCRDPVCPEGMIEGGSCNLLPGQQKCDFGFDCINGFCCAPSCPSGVVGPSCDGANPCKPGYSCIGGKCCRDPVCPKGMIEGGSCNLLPGQQKCDFGFDCINGFCCAPSCPSGVVGPSCDGANPCKPGYSCIGGKCCRKY